VLKVGEQVLVSVNGGAVTLRFARHAFLPEQVRFYVLQCDIETAMGIAPPLPVASGWMSPADAKMLGSKLK
jgi:hypothetical protein